MGGPGNKGNASTSKGLAKETNFVPGFGPTVTAILACFGAQNVTHKSISPLNKITEFSIFQ